jgi:hypothetical protein
MTGKELLASAEGSTTSTPICGEPESPDRVGDDGAVALQISRTAQTVRRVENAHLSAVHGY